MSDEATTCRHDWRWGFAGMPTASWFGHESAAFLRSPRPKLCHCLSCRQTECFNPNAGHWGEWEQLTEAETESPASGGPAEELSPAS